MKYSCIIIDDNLIECDLIEAYLRKLNQFDIKAVFNNSIDALNYINSNKIDIVFSDIDMPDINGLSLFKSTKLDSIFIFITAHSEYAIDSYNLEGFDFLVKPVQLERLIQSSNKALAYLEMKKKAEASDIQINENDSKNYFFIKETKGHTRLNHNDVFYIESLGDFSTLYTENSKHVTLVSLKKLQEQLPETYFKRVHKQFIVNLVKIHSISNNEIILKNNNVIPLSLSYKIDILNHINSNTISR